MSWFNTTSRQPFYIPPGGVNPNPFDEGSYSNQQPHFYPRQPPAPPSFRNPFIRNSNQNNFNWGGRGGYNGGNGYQHNPWLAQQHHQYPTYRYGSNQINQPTWISTRHQSPHNRSKTSSRPPLPPAARTHPRPPLPPAARTHPRPPLPPEVPTPPKPPLPPEVPTYPRPRPPLPLQPSARLQNPPLPPISKYPLLPLMPLYPTPRYRQSLSLLPQVPKRRPLPPEVPKAPRPYFSRKASALPQNPPRRPLPLYPTPTCQQSVSLLPQVPRRKPLTPEITTRHSQSQSSHPPKKISRPQQPNQGGANFAKNNSTRPHELEPHPRFPRGFLSEYAKNRFDIAVNILLAGTQTMRWGVFINQICVKHIIVGMTDNLRWKPSESLTSFSNWLRSNEKCDSKRFQMLWIIYFCMLHDDAWPPYEWLQYANHISWMLEVVALGCLDQSNSNREELDIIIRRMEKVVPKGAFLELHNRLLSDSYGKLRWASFRNTSRIRPMEYFHPYVRLSTCICPCCLLPSTLGIDMNSSTGGIKLHMEKYGNIYSCLPKGPNAPESMRKEFQTYLQNKLISDVTSNADSEDDDIVEIPVPKKVFEIITIQDKGDSDTNVDTDTYVDTDTDIDRDDSHVTVPPEVFPVTDSDVDCGDIAEPSILQKRPKLSSKSKASEPFSIPEKNRLKPLQPESTTKIYDEMQLFQPDPVTYANKVIQRNKESTKKVKPLEDNKDGGTVNDFSESRSQSRRKISSSKSKSAAESSSKVSKQKLESKLEELPLKFSTDPNNSTNHVIWNDHRISQDNFVDNVLAKTLQTWDVVERNGKMYLQFVHSTASSQTETRN